MAWYFGVDKSIWSVDQRRLCQRLRSLRQAAGLSQSDLAEQLGVSQSFVTKYETGDRRLDLFQLRAVCQMLDTRLSDLVAEFDEPETHLP